jgi:uncharacterized protein (TIGR02147 family)
MMTESAHYLSLLRADLAQRQRRNPHFSLRAYAKLLGVQAPTLSAVLRGKRPLPLSTANAIARRLRLAPAEQSRFVESVRGARRNSRGAGGWRPTSLERALLREDAHFHVIAEWEHYAILALFDVEGFRPQVAWVARRLGVSASRAGAALERLRASGLIEVRADGTWDRRHEMVETTEDVRSDALRASHREALEMGIVKLEEVEVGRRDFSSETFAIDPARLAEAKSLIREFRRRMIRLARGGRRGAVYQLCVQLYPLSHPKEEKLT